MQANKYEIKIIGKNIIWITIILVIVFSYACITGGNLVNWGYLGFEVCFPLYTAIMIAEHVTIKTDRMYEVIVVHTKNLFQWIFRRFIYVYLFLGGIFIIDMVWLSNIMDLNLREILIIYGGTSLFFSTLAIVCSLCLKYEHSAACVCGIVWLFLLLIRSLARIPNIAVIYPFIRFVKEDSPIWFQNKIILFIVSLVLWGEVYIWTKLRGTKCQKNKKTIFSKEK